MLLIGNKRQQFQWENLDRILPKGIAKMFMEIIGIFI